MSTREITYGKQFKKDISKKSNLKYLVSNEWAEVLYLLSRDEELPAIYKDHALIGDKKDFRSCHVFFDLVLIYCVKFDGKLGLIRLGTHSEVY